MAADMGKLFDVYWYLGKPGATVPTTWPKIYSTDINRNTSMQIKFNGTDATTYLSVSHWSPSLVPLSIDIYPSQCNIHNTDNIRLFVVKQQPINQWLYFVCTFFV